MKRTIDSGWGRSLSDRAGDETAWTSLIMLGVDRMTYSDPAVLPSAESAGAVALKACSLVLSLFCSVLLLASNFKCAKDVLWSKVAVQMYRGSRWSRSFSIPAGLLLEGSQSAQGGSSTASLLHSAFAQSQPAGHRRLVFFNPP